MPLIASETSLSVGVADGEVLAANEARVGLIISSPATNPVHLTLGAASAANFGVTLRPGGDPLVLYPGLYG